jgi:hypothetical protein
MKSYSVSTWICKECDFTADVTYPWIQRNGTLTCNGCDRDMKFKSERWVISTPRKLRRKRNETTSTGCK